MMLPNQEPTEHLSVGSFVRVRSGPASVCHGYERLRIGGWTGTVRRTDPESTVLYCRVEFDANTLNQISYSHLKQLARKRISIDSLKEQWVLASLLEPATGEPSVIDPPTIENENRPLDPDNEGDWIRGYLGLTSNDPLHAEGELDINNFLKYFRLITEAPTQEIIRTMFPAIADWVQRRGKIEIGFSGEESIKVTLADANGAIFEDSKSKTFAEALNELEETLALHSPTPPTHE